MDQTFANRFKSATLPIIIGWATLVILPTWYAFFKYNSHVSVKRVDSSTCTCNCWDEILKGPHQDSNNVAYKHIYLNATGTSFKILILLTTGVVLLYESAKHIVKLSISKNIRYSMVILFLANVYPLIYIWTICLNNLNDGVYDGVKDKKLLYISSGLFSCAIALHLANCYNQITYSKLASIFSIGFGHILTKRARFITNLIQKSSSSEHPEHLPRDRGLLLLPDILSIITTVFLLTIELNKNHRFGRENKLDIILYVFAVAGYCQLAESL